MVEVAATDEEVEEEEEGAVVAEAAAEGGSRGSAASGAHPKAERGSKSTLIRFTEVILIHKIRKPMSEL